VRIFEDGLELSLRSKIVLVGLAVVKIDGNAAFRVGCDDCARSMGVVVEPLPWPKLTAALLNAFEHRRPLVERDGKLDTLGAHVLVRMDALFRHAAGECAQHPIHVRRVTFRGAAVSRSSGCSEQKRSFRFAEPEC